MANTAIGIGAALLVLGIAGFLGTGSQAYTALIPAGFGLALLVLGVLARDERRRKHAMHVAAVVGLLGVLGAVRGIVPLFRMISGEDVVRPAAVIAQAIMFALCLTFEILCVRSFMDARRNRAV